MSYNILNDLNALVLPRMTKAEKTAVVGNVGMIIYDTTANKISIKVADAALIGSWELVTSVPDA
jgi:hypothetical protein